ncbi:unnamed protein product [Dibothriocephalus latus]|uniref:ABC transmembrane type-1 domain-containing protein n=1 Tax=Dibothriocephalus latus TaxID=60516 RepID=A0A3P7N774_DIBLA|nr:unnamed protein product [Dibothriocephalus latus]
MMYKEGGYMSIFGVLTMLLFIPIQTISGKIIASIKGKVARLTDERVKMLTEMINGIQILKFFNWEATFGKFVKALRRNARTEDCVIARS